MACGDGYLRVYLFGEQRLVATFRSYFGGLLCVAWSASGAFLLTGGEDDCVTLIDFASVRGCSCNNVCVRVCVVDVTPLPRCSDVYWRAVCVTIRGLVAWHLIGSFRKRAPCALDRSDRCARVCGVVSLC